MATFFISDTHFLHARILELGDGRPFKDIDHHNSSLVANWNSVVTPEDDVIHLGDVALGKWPLGLLFLEQCNGTKFLIPGNHDRISSTEKLSRRVKFLNDYEEVFDEIWGEVEPFVVGGVPVMLSHYPYDGDSHDGDRFSDLRAPDEGLPLIHGHTHSSEKVSFSKNGTPMLSVGVDANEFTPVHENAVAEWLREVTSA